MARSIAVHVNTITGTNIFLNTVTFGAGGAAIVGVDVFARRGIALNTFDTATTFGPHSYLAELNDITRLDDLLVTSLTGRDGQIYISDDSGRSWDLNPAQLIPDYTYLQSQAITSTEGSDLFVTADTLLYRSTDRGSSWQIVKTFTPAVGIDNLDFSPDGFGHLTETDIQINAAMESLYSRSIYTSRDGGYMWDSIFSYTVPANQIANLEVDFSSSEVGVAGFGTFSRTTLVRTINGGVTWDTVAEMDGGVRDIQMFNQQVGIVVGGDRGGMILLTRDGGKTWSRPDNIPLPDTTVVDLRFASLFPDGRTLLIGGAGISLKGSFAESVLSVRTADPYINARHTDIRLFSHPVRNNVLRGSLGEFEPGIARYDITGIDGKTVLSGTVIVHPDANFMIDLQNSGIPAGSYILSLHGNGDIAEAMFVVVE